MKIDNYLYIYISTVRTDLKSYFVFVDVYYTVTATQQKKMAVTLPCCGTVSADVSGRETAFSLPI
jgi:hypothetical protein